MDCAERQKKGPATFIAGPVVCAPVTLIGGGLSASKPADD